MNIPLSWLSADDRKRSICWSTGVATQAIDEGGIRRSMKARINEASSLSETNIRRYMSWIRENLSSQSMVPIRESNDCRL